MTQKYGIIKVLRLTQARQLDAAHALLYHISAQSIGLCESQQPHRAIDWAFCVQSEAEMIKQCLACEMEFKTSHARTKYCSRACADIAKRDTLRGVNNPNYRGGRGGVCTVCGNTFPNYSARRRTCSKECYGKIRKKPRALKQASFFDQCGFRWCECIKCGKRFQYHSSAKKYCQKCDAPGTYYKRCRVCKKEFSTRMKRQVLCSRECYNTEMAIRQKGERSHRWKGGLTRPEMLLRSSKEYKDWRSAVFARDDYTCQICFERGGKLAAHHIREYAKHPELRLLIGNGITLCWLCHQSIRGKERTYETTFYDITGGT